MLSTSAPSVHILVQGRLIQRPDIGIHLYVIDCLILSALSNNGHQLVITKAHTKALRPSFTFPCPWGKCMQNSWRVKCRSFHFTPKLAKAAWTWHVQIYTGSCNVWSVWCGYSDDPWRNHHLQSHLNIHDGYMPFFQKNFNAQMFVSLMRRGIRVLVEA